MAEFPLLSLLVISGVLILFFSDQIIYFLRKRKVTRETKFSLTFSIILLILLILNLTIGVILQPYIAPYRIGVLDLFDTFGISVILAVVNSIVLLAFSMMKYKEILKMRFSIWFVNVLFVSLILGLLLSILNEGLNFPTKITIIIPSLLGVFIPVTILSILLSFDKRMQKTEEYKRWKEYGSGLMLPGILAFLGMRFLPLLAESHFGISGIPLAIVAGLGAILGGLIGLTIVNLFKTKKKKSW